MHVHRYSHNQMRNNNLKKKKHLGHEEDYPKLIISMAELAANKCSHSEVFVKSAPIQALLLLLRSDPFGQKQRRMSVQLKAMGLFQLTC